MNSESISKIQPRHLLRLAFLYVRQSTLRQVLENTESTERQYALRQKAMALGWPAERIVVIDSDQGQSGAAADREGFQRLVTEVGMGRAGLVLGLEVSRLARNSTDWHRLLEMCALTDTLLLDEDGVYDPAHFNDRLLLGLKGTMSEAELHILRARLLGGKLNKARRGELTSTLPIGFVYDDLRRVVLDPDQRVQDSLRLFFSTFRRTGSATATMRAFRDQGLTFPRRVRLGTQRREVVFALLSHGHALEILHNPRYAGAYFYGRSRHRYQPDAQGRKSQQLPREQWTALIRDAHPGYISWDEFEDNQRKLSENAFSHGEERTRRPPREGPALLQGLVLCGVCGRRMTVHYHHRKKALCPEYICLYENIQKGGPICQVITGAEIDTAVAKLILEAVNPLGVQVALAVQMEMQQRVQEADALRRKHVEQAQYEVELARRRYMRVDPDHRLVVDTLEADWNHKLRALQQAQMEYEQKRHADRKELSSEQQAGILALASDLPRLWSDPKTHDRDRKRIARLILLDVTLRKTKEAITVQIRFRGGTQKTLSIPPPRSVWEQFQLSPEILAEMDRLLDDHTDGRIAEMLNARGLQSGMGRPFSQQMVARLRKDYGLSSRYERLRARGMLTAEEVAQQLGISIDRVFARRKAGLFKTHAYDDRPHHLYEPPDPNPTTLTEACPTPV